jgi:enoyl-CoA hydratase
VAREYAYTGRRMPAARAKEVGLVNEVYADQATMLSAVLDIAAEIASKSPLAIWGSKEMITYARDHSTADALNYIATWQTGMFQPADMMETFAAKAEQRDPAFDDLLPNPEGL